VSVRVSVGGEEQVSFRGTCAVLCGWAADERDPPPCLFARAMKRALQRRTTFAYFF
jgi:hypothetical protein